MAIRASAATVCEQFAATAAARPTAIAIRTRDASISWTWADYAERARSAAGGFAALGVRRQDTVGLWLRNRPAFHAADAGAMLLGAVPVSIYTTATDAHAAFVVQDSGCRVLVTEPAFLGAALTIRNAGTTNLETIVLVDGEGPGTISWEEMLRRDPGHDVAAATARVQPEDTVALVYTAGTAGLPTGVRITHASVAAQTAAAAEALGLTEDLRVVSSLSMATIAERLCAQYLPMRLGWEVTCCPDPALADVFLREVRPGFYFAPPRAWDVLKAAVMARIDTAEALRALEASLQRVHLQRTRQPVPADLTAACAAADAAFFTPLRARLGLDQIRHALIGAAHCPLELTAFFHAIGVPVMELYGLSEATGIVCLNTTPDGRIGTVGHPLPGCEIRLAEDDEILVRAPFVAPGYQDGPNGGTRPTTDADGWLATGDVGHLDADGALQILDRVDALIRSGDGRTVSPAVVEGALRRASPLVGHACIVGESRSYTVALLTLNAAGAREWARDHDLRGSDLGVLAEHPEVLGAVADGVARANAGLEEHEQVRRFLLLGADWSPGGDELTQTLKLKRSLIAGKYAPEIDALYDGDGIEPAHL